MKIKYADKIYEVVDTMEFDGRIYYTVEDELEDELSYLSDNKMIKQNKNKIIDLKLTLLDYISKYKMYPCTQQIMDYVNYKFNELIKNLGSNNI